MLLCFVCFQWDRFFEYERIEEFDLAEKIIDYLNDLDNAGMDVDTCGCRF